ncbi:hypothetical protein GCM10010371_63870 [Streptomyces subrutilus]|uniref:Uncharacterized protein n=1 Tax=Streptomyces subrutilus TaxID=36818 RepID=A0A918RDT8_9ACTN|nr:hypothetical protein GCM10010371_63870 [Streptomyces subrutilus]
MRRVRKAARGGGVLLGWQTEHRFEGRVLLALDGREEAVRDGAGGRGVEAGQDLGLGGRDALRRAYIATFGWGN